MIITTSFEITNQQIADLMTTAIEGGSNYWCDQILMLKGQPVLKPWYADPLLYGSPFELKVGTKILTNDDLHRAMQQMADEYPTHFSDVVNDNPDADTADVFLQLAVLGEITYG
jgi:hypothetical protein